MCMYILQKHRRGKPLTNFRNVEWIGFKAWKEMLIYISHMLRASFINRSKTVSKSKVAVLEVEVVVRGCGRRLAN